MGGDEYDLASLGKWTRVDWHKNPARIHVFFISKTPLKDLAQSKDNKIIEVYGEKPHVVCVYGNHFDGNPIMPYETEKIAVLDDITRLEIENRVKLVIPSYLDNDAVNKYVKELEKPETIVSKGSVHIAVRTMLMSVYFRSNGKFANIPDEERFQRVVDWDKQKAIQAGRPAYIDANPKKLEDLWEGIRKKYQDQRQKEREEGRKERANGNGNGNGNGTTPPEERKYLNERIVALLIGSPPNDPIRWLTDAIMREHIFATMDDNDDVYRYSQSQGIFLNGGATIVKKQIELLRPNTTTYEVREILNHIRHRTYVSRSDFDSNIDILNTDNCTLNIHTLEMRPHSPDYLSLVKIPAHYDPDAKCPLLLQFFNQVLRPEDIPVVLQMIGYCLYKTIRNHSCYSVEADPMVKECC